ncbi:hypothetical protein GBA52_010378 [Prunus armeniaca]|nr:hypothetical protein GBA52_010378 [Prunus armeniaca]
MSNDSRHNGYLGSRIDENPVNHRVFERQVAPEAIRPRARLPAASHVVAPPSTPSGLRGADDGLPCA